MRTRHRSGRTVILLCAAAVQLTGCALYGPDVTRTSHLAYNEAVQASAQQELLLNLEAVEKPPIDFQEKFDVEPASSRFELAGSRPNSHKNQIFSFCTYMVRPAMQEGT